MAKTIVEKYSKVKGHWNGFEQRWDDDQYVYIGRGHGRSKQPESIWHNPFKVGKDGTREEVIAKYREYLYDNPELLRQVMTLKGKTLVCWCAPEACHGDVLAELANSSGGLSLQKKGGGIEWTHVPGYVGMTANPVRGCQHGCQWEMPDGQIANCYAEDVAMGVASGAYPKGFRHISFHPEVLMSIRRRKKASAIFIDSMSDLMGRGVKDSWIQAVIDMMVDCPQHIFILLTKNPKRLLQFSFPDNCWVGVSAPPTYMFGKELTQAQQEQWYSVALKTLGQVDAKVKWTSIEPLSWDCSDIISAHAEVLDWAVIGAASSGARTYQPDRDVFNRVLGVLDQHQIPVFYKGNLDTALVGVWREDFPVITTKDTKTTKKNAKQTDKVNRFLFNGAEMSEDDFGAMMRIRQGRLLPARSSIVQPERGVFYPRRALALDTITQSDVLAYLMSLPSNSVHCVVTSPPYYGLRDYNEDEQIGFEETAEDFIARLVRIFREVRRVLRPDGVCWVNIADSAVSAKGRYRRNKIDTRINAKAMPTRTIDRYGELKDKDLYLIPQRLVIVLQNDGWWVRSDVIWRKGNPSPDTAKDRVARKYEHIFQLTKKAHYWYDWTADTKAPAEKTLTTYGIKFRNVGDDGTGLIRSAGLHASMDVRKPHPAGVLLGDVWDDLKQVGFKGEHYATFPVSLPERCIKLSCPPMVCAECGTGYVAVTTPPSKSPPATQGETCVPRKPRQLKERTKLAREAGGAHDDPFGKHSFEGYAKNCDCDCVEIVPGVVLDPFMGAGTTALAAKMLGRHYVGCDLNADYVTMARTRLAEYDFAEAQVDPLADTVIDTPDGESIVQMSLFS